MKEIIEQNIENSQDNSYIRSLVGIVSHKKEIESFSANSIHFLMNGKLVY